MAKPKSKANIQTQYDRHNKLSAARQLKYRQRMSEEQKEEYRRKARERYNKRKAEKTVKSIKDLSLKEQKENRKMWKKHSKNLRDKRKREKEAVSLTPPVSDDEIISGPSRQQIARGRKVRRDKAKAYRDIRKKDNKIKELE